MVLARWDLHSDWMTVPLSLGERVRVRGKQAFFIPTCRTNPGTAELREASGQAGCFPKRL
jgi:hypothetical protein